MMGLDDLNIKNPLILAVLIVMSDLNFMLS